MRTTFTLKIAGFLLAGIFGAQAQTLNVVLAATPTTSTIGGNSSVRVGTSAGNNLFSGGVNTFLGYQSGMAAAGGFSNLFAGAYSGKANTEGFGNVFLGYNSGAANIGSLSPFTGGNNVFVGSSSGSGNVTGVNNVYVGTNSGLTLTGGYNNVLVGFGAGATMTAAGTGENSIFGYYAGYHASGGSNTFIGRSAGENANNGNTLIGNFAGQNAVSDNVMIGTAAGQASAVSQQLFIDNTNTTKPLIWGDFLDNTLKLHGKVGIGATFPATFPSPSTTFPTAAPTGFPVTKYNLFVAGGILTEEMRVLSIANWADYVFDEDYQLKPLSEVEAFIAKNGHLPNVPSASQIKTEGFEVGEMAKIQQEKIEELTLYLIQLQKEMESMKSELNALKGSNN